MSWHGVVMFIFWLCGGEGQQRESNPWIDAETAVSVGVCSRLRMNGWIPFLLSGMCVLVMTQNIETLTRDEASLTR